MQSSFFSRSLSVNQRDRIRLLLQVKRGFLLTEETNKQTNKQANKRTNKSKETECYPQDQYRTINESVVLVVLWLLYSFRQPMLCLLSLLVMFDRS